MLQQQPGSTEHHPSQTSGSVGSTRVLHRDKGISAAFTSSSSDTQLLQPKPPLHAAAQAIFDKHLQPPAFKGPKRNNRQLLLLFLMFNTVLDRGEAAGTNMQSNSKSPGARGRPPTAQLLYLLPAVSVGALSLQLLLRRAPERDEVMAETKPTHTERRGLAWDCVSMSQVCCLTGIQCTPTRRPP